VSLDVGDTMQEVEGLESSCAEGTVSLSEGDARAGGMFQSAMDPRRYAQTQLLLKFCHLRALLP